jgi:lambda family phage portal protein
MAMKTAFDGATQGFRLERKGLMSGSADTLSARELKHLWNRSHHLCRNNPAAVTARNRLIAHWVGTGLKVKWSNSVIQKAWDQFAKNPSLDGYGNLHSMETLWAGSYFESGEVFTRMMVQRRPDCPVPLKLQVIEAEQLDPLYFLPDGVRHGIKFDAFGKPVEYNFWNHHPNEMRIGEVLKRTSIPAQDVLHIFMRERPGQWRGIPKLTPALLAIYEMDELTDATLVRQKAAQAIGWIIKKQNSGALPLLGNIGDAPPQDVEEVGNRIQKILPGGVHYLEADEDFEFASTSDIGNNLITLLEHQWRLIASCLDVTYEQLTGDLSGVNFSSIRAGLIEFRRRVAMTQLLIFVTQGLGPLADRFQELSKLYLSANAANATFKIIFPKTEWVDPLKDVQADIAEIRAGLATMEEKLYERGVEDIEAHIKQIGKEQGYNIVVDSNPVHNTQDKTEVTDQQDSPADVTTKPKSKTKPGE